MDLLEYEGHVVIECDNGADALKAAERENPDLVITDSRMPGISGIELIAGIRKLTRALRTPIVFHTAAGDEREIRETAAAYGVTAILTKPCPANTMLAQITSALNAPRREPIPAPSKRLRARIPVYLASCDEDVAAVELALAADDFVLVQEVGHNLKGTGSAYGFCHISCLGAHLESAATANDRIGIAEQLKELVSYLGAIKITSTEVADRTEDCSQCMIRNNCSIP